MNATPMLPGRRIGITCLALAALCFGCSRDTGPEKFSCSGQVTFGGEPVGVGYLSFEPDFEAGGSGPGSMAKIEDGRYRTDNGKGIVGGPYKVRIVGFDGNPPDGLGDGNILFPEVTVAVDFPMEATVQNFEVATEKPHTVTFP